jgi:hypothetical protein
LNVTWIRVRARGDSRRVVDRRIRLLRDLRVGAADVLGDIGDAAERVAPADEHHIEIAGDARSVQRDVDARREILERGPGRLGERDRTRVAGADRRGKLVDADARSHPASNHSTASLIQLS